MNKHRKKRILIVEDDAVSREFENRMFKEFGYSVTSAQSGEEAVSAVHEDPRIDMVVMDINLGEGIDGIEAAKQILDKRCLPVVFLTSNENEKDLAKISSITRYGYLLKNSGKAVIKSSIEMAFALFDALQARQDSEENYRLLIENAISGVAVHEILLDPEGKPIDFVYLVANPAFEIHTGLKASDVVGRRVTEIIPDVKQTGLIEKCGRVALTGEPTSSEQYIESLDRCFVINAYQVGEKRFATIFTDVTERRRAENVLNIQHETSNKLNTTITLRDAADIILDGAMQLGGFDCGGVYIFNPEDQTLTLAAHKGLSQNFVSGVSRYYSSSSRLRVAIKGQILYQNYTDISAPDYNDLADEGLRSFAAIPIINPDGLVAVLNLAFRNKDAVPEWLREPLESFALQTGNALTRIIAMQKMHENEQFLRRLTDALPKLVYVFRWTQDGRMKFDFLSRAAKTITGYPAELLVKDFSIAWALVLPEDAKALEASLLQARRSGSRWEHEFRIRTPDGALKWISGLSVPEKNPEDNVIRWVGTLTDITENKRAEEKQNTLQARLINTQKMELIGQLAAGMAHEINTPVQFVGDNLQFLKDTFGGLFKLLDTAIAFTETAADSQENKLFKKTLKEIISALEPDYVRKEIPSAINESIEGINTVARIVKAMKEFSHSGTDKLMLYDVNKALENTVVISRNEWKHVTEMETCLEENLPAAPCLPNELNQAFLNIIVNAAHAISEVADKNKKGIIRITTWSEPEWIVISISDTGTGIPQNIQDKVFSPFFTTKPVGEGTGQGLSIAYNSIVNRMGGKLEFKSEKGKGTTFFIKLKRNSQTEEQDT